MSHEHLHTPEEAKALLCPMRGGNCAATACMAWRGAWQDRDGFEEHTEEQAHWSQLVQTEPSALALILATRLGQSTAQDLGERWVKLWQSSPRDFLEAVDEDVDEDEPAGLLDRVNAAADEALDDQDSYLGQEGEELEPAEYHAAVIAFREAVEEIAHEINTALEAATTPEIIEKFVEEKRPGGIEWGVKQSGIENGVIFAIYQRPIVRRGYCGLAGRAA